MRDKSQEPFVELGMYRHFKGGEYEVFGVFLDVSEGREDEWMVLYKTALGKMCVRNCEEFTGVVYSDDESKRRFEKI